MKKLLIYTGPVKSGKTSRLLSFVQSKKEFGGILSPVFGGKKYLYDIQTGERKLLESDDTDPESEIIRVGRYKFRKSVFEWGQDVLKKAFAENPVCIIIDEIGKLELTGSGLSPAADEIIGNVLKDKPEVIVVVRESLIEKFFKRYNLMRDDVEFLNPQELRKKSYKL